MQHGELEGYTEWHSKIIKQIKGCLQETTVLTNMAYELVRTHTGSLVLKVVPIRRVETFQEEHKFSKIGNPARAKNYTYAFRVDFKGVNNVLVRYRLAREVVEETLSMNSPYFIKQYKALLLRFYTLCMKHYTIRPSQNEYLDTFLANVDTVGFIKPFLLEDDRLNKRGAFTHSRHLFERTYPALGIGLLLLENTKQRKNKLYVIGKGTVKRKTTRDCQTSIKLTYEPQGVQVESVTGYLKTNAQQALPSSLVPYEELGEFRDLFIKELLAMYVMKEQVQPVSKEPIKQFLPRPSVDNFLIQRGIVKLIEHVTYKALDAVNTRSRVLIKRVADVGGQPTMSVDAVTEYSDTTAFTDKLVFHTRGIKRLKNEHPETEVLYTGRDGVQRPIKESSYAREFAQVKKYASTAFSKDMYGVDVVKVSYLLGMMLETSSVLNCYETLEVTTSLEKSIVQNPNRRTKVVEIKIGGARVLPAKELTVRYNFILKEKQREVTKNYTCLVEIGSDKMTRYMYKETPLIDIVAQVLKTLEAV